MGRVERWRRDGAWWIDEDIIGTAMLELTSVGVTVPLDEVYTGSGL